MPQSRSLSFAMVGLAIVFVLLAVLYGLGSIQFLTRTGSGHHTAHSILLVVLAIVALVLARFVWPQRRTA
jgi:accessory gene regulator protein AgrB